MMCSCGRAECAPGMDLCGYCEQDHARRVEEEQEREREDAERWADFVSDVEIPY